MKTWQAILIGLVIGFLGGVGTMQVTIVREVQEHSSEIKHLQLSYTAANSMFEKRIDNVVRLWEASLESSRALLDSNKQLIVLVQQSILSDLRKQSMQSPKNP